MSKTVLLFLSGLSFMALLTHCGKSDEIIPPPNGGGGSTKTTTKSAPVINSAVPETPANTGNTTIDKIKPIEKPRKQTAIEKYDTELLGYMKDQLKPAKPISVIELEDGEIVLSKEVKLTRVWDVHHSEFGDFVSYRIVFVNPKESEEGKKGPLGKNYSASYCKFTSELQPPAQPFFPAQVESKIVSPQKLEILSAQVEKARSFIPRQGDQFFGDRLVIRFKTLPYMLVCFGSGEAEEPDRKPFSVRPTDLNLVLATIGMEWQSK